MTHEELARQIMTIAIAKGDEKSRCIAVLDACEAAEKAGMDHYEVLATIVMSFVSASGALLTATVNALTDEPRGAILR